MSSITSTTQTRSNIMIDMPSSIAPPVSSENAITLASALPANYFPRNEDCTSFGSTISFTCQVSANNLLQNTLTLNASLPFTVTLVNAQTAAVTDQAAIAALIFGANGSGQVALAQYGLVNAFDAISVALNGSDVYTHNAVDDIQKCILPYSDCGSEYQASLPGFADPKIYDSQLSTTPIAFPSLDGTVKYRYINPNDCFNIFSNATTPEYNNRAVDFSFDSIAANTNTVTMYVNFRYQFPLSFFIPNNAGEQSTLMGIENFSVRFTTNNIYKYGLFKVSASGTSLVSNIVLNQNLLNNSSFKLGYTIVVPQNYVKKQVIVNNKPRNYNINYDDYELTNGGTFPSSSIAFAETGFQKYNVSINSIPKAVIVALIPKKGTSFDELKNSSEGYGLITSLTIGVSSSASPSIFPDAETVNQVTDQNGYRSINPFVKQLCGYPVMIKTSQMPFDDDVIAGQKLTGGISLNVSGRFRSPLVSQLFDLIVIVQNEKTLSFINGQFSQSDGFSITSKDIDISAIYQEGILMNTQASSIVRGGLSLGPLIKTATKAFHSLYKNRGRIADLAKDIYRDTTAGRTTSNITGGEYGGKSVADYHY